MELCKLSGISLAALGQAFDITMIVVSFVVSATIGAIPPIASLACLLVILVGDVGLSTFVIHGQT